MGGVTTFTETTKVYRDGSKAVVDRVYPPAMNANGTHNTRTVYDLKTGKNQTWDPNDPSQPCAAGEFSGDWGDAFATSARMLADLGKQNPTIVGDERLNGFDVKVQELALPGGKGKVKLWVDKKYGLVVRSEMIPASGPSRTMLEIRKFDAAKPAASVFAVPAACGN